MSSTGWTPTIVPYGADQTLYLVVDRFGRFGSVYRETDVERTDLETIITDLMSGQFNDPVRVVAFNTLEHWSQDVSKDIALEIQTRCDIDGEEIPESLRDFIDSNRGPYRQLALRLGYADIVGCPLRSRSRASAFWRRCILEALHRHVEEVFNGS